METLNSSTNLIQNVSKRNDLLKLIAMITMLIDHVGLLFFPGVFLYRTIGRIAFPIFAYQLAIGYQKTHSRFSYVKRLFIFAIISQFPYVFLNQDLKLNVFHFNVIFLFLYGVLVLWVFDLCSTIFNQLKLKKNLSNLFLWILLSMIFICMIFLPLVLEIMFSWFVFSYSTYGILMILIFYIFNKRPLTILISYVLMSFVTTYLKGGVYLIGGLTGSILRIQTYGANLIGSAETNLINILSWQGGLTTLGGYFFQLRSLLGLCTIVILESLKPRFKLNKYVAYWFYPVHIALLLLLRIIIKG